jgi:gliding motility-associated-like protein
VPGFPSYQWSTGSTGPSITVQQSGDYWLIAGSAQCSDTDSVNVFFMPDINIPDVKSPCDSDKVLLDAGNVTGAQLQWSTGDTVHAIYVSEPGTYWVVASKGSCIKSDSVVVGEFSSSTQVWVPNVFTPNRDNKNETFLPVITNAKNYSLLIFNRWGELIFETDNPLLAWDGTYKNRNCTEGVYVYIINYTGDCGAQGEKHSKPGHVTLLR